MNYIVPLMIGMILGTGALMLTSMGSIAYVPTATLTPDKPFVYTFNSAGTLYEAGSITESTSPYWWVNSGAKLIMKDGIGMTVQDELSSSDRWYTLYKKANPTDTDNGTHPQNLFRLVSRNAWGSVREQAQFRIREDNLSGSSNRNASNGLLLMSRYAPGGDTLYYAGIRVDGDAVIKKKYKGTYYTMAQKEIFPGTYDRTSNPNLLPHNEWLNLRLDTVTKSDGTVELRLYLLQEGESVWKLIASAVDDGKKYGGTPPLKADGYVGIRTDFMDVEFETLRVEKL
jgi:hypothetical protein